jgi:hypothetical protein
MVDKVVGPHVARPRPVRVKLRRINANVEKPYPWP